MNPTGRPPSRGVSTPLATAARPSFPYSGWTRVAISLATFGIYVLAFLPLSGLFGAPAAALATIPVMASGWLLGAWAGLFAGALTIPLNTLLLNLAGYPGWDALIRLWGGPGTLALIFIGLGVGRLHDLSDRLKLELAQRRRTETLLQENEARLRATLAHAPIVLWALDRNGVFTLSEGFGLAALGLKPGQAVGQSAFDVYHDVPQVLEDSRRALAGEAFTSRVEVSGVVFEAHYSPVRAPDGAIVGTMGVATDITEHKRVEAALRDSEERYRAILQQSVEAIYLFDADTRQLLEANPAFLRLLGYAAEEVTSLTVYDVAAHDRTDIDTTLAKVQKLGRLLVGERLWRRKDGQLVEVDVAFSLIRLRGKAIFVVVARDMTERKRREQELEAFVAVSTALRTAGAHAEMVSIILDQVMALLGAQGAVLDLYNPHNGEIVTKLGRGQWAASTGLIIPPGEGVSRSVIATGQPYINNAVRVDPTFFRSDLLGEIQAVAAVPLIAQRQIVGALIVGRSRDRHLAGFGFGDREVRVLVAIADMAANALRRAALHEQTEQHLQRLAALHTIDAAINASLDSRATLEVLLDQVINQLQVDAAALLLLNPLTQTLDYAAGRGFRNPAIQHTPKRLGEGETGRAALEGRIIAVSDLRESARAGARTGLLIGEGFVSYYAVPLIAKGQVKGVLEICQRTALAREPEWLDFLKTLAEQAAIAVENAQLFDGLQRSNRDLSQAYDATIEGWSRALDLRDKETEGHTQRVTEITERLARAMGVGDGQLMHIRRGALLHDIGKMGVPDSILLKPGPLTAGEWAIMHRHPQYAYDMLSPIDYLGPALDIPFCHHEKWDGTGYPRGLKGEQIPLAARLFTVVDVWDALRSNRPNRPAWSEEQTRDYIRGQSGQHFDPQALAAFWASGVGGE